MSSAKTPAKALSSKLLTMKFMQRAAASPSSPTTSEEPTPKRRKTEAASTPPKFNVDALADQRAVQAAIAGEEAKRQLAIEKQAAEAGDTRWVLSFDDQKQAAAAPFLSLKIVETGFASLDTLPTKVQYMVDDEDEKPEMVGRRSFGRFNKTLEKQQDPAYEDSDSSSDEDNQDEQDGGDDLDPDDPTTELIRAERQQAIERAKAERKAKKREEQAGSMRMAKERKKKEVALNSLTSLSGSMPLPNKISCFSCGGNHKKADCPNKRRYSGGDDGPPRKTHKTKAR